MAVGESAGTVYVTIDGDASPLGAKLAQAEAMSRAAGQGVAAGFSAAASGPNVTATALDRLIQVIQEESAAASLATQRNIAMAAGIRQVGSSAEGTTGKMYQASAAIRTAFGETSIRAVERLTTMIPGLSTLFANAFPIFGLIQLGLMFEKATEKSEALKAAEKELEDQNKKLDDSFNETAKTIYRVAAESQARNFGPAAGTAERIKGLNDEGRESQRVVAQLKEQIKEVAATAASDLQTHPWRTYSSDAEVAKDKIAALGKQIEEEREKQRRLGIERSGLQELGGTQLAEQRGALGTKQIEALEQASVRAAAISKQTADAEIDAAHGAQQQRIAGLESEYARVVSTGNEEIRFEKAKEDEIAGYALATRDRTIKEIAAKAGAESAGKSAPEQALISTGAQSDTQKAKDDYTLAVGKAALDVQKSQADAALKLDELNQKVAQTLNNEVRAGWEKVEAAAHKTTEDSIAATTKDLEIKTRVAEIQEKSSGDVKALQIKAQEIVLEGQYGNEVTHTLSEQIGYMQQIAALEHQEREAKIQGLKSELDTAEALDTELRDLEKIATLKGEIAKLTQEDANASAQAANQQTKLAADKSLSGQIKQGIGGGSLKENVTAAEASTVVSAVNGISEALARAVTQGGHLGKIFGDLGKQLAMSAATNLLKAGLNAALQALMRMVPAFGAASAAASASAIQQKATAELGVMTAAGEGAAWAFESVMAALPFPVNIAVAPGVAASTLAQIMSIGQFADGTDSAPGGMALVGEKGPEIVNLPRGSQVIPNNAIHKYADGTPGYSSSTHYKSTSFQTGSTELHFHAHGMNNPDKFIDHVMRKLPETLKRRSPIFSPLSH